MKYLYVLFLGLFLSSNLLKAQDFYLHCGNMLDIQSGKFLKNKTIIVSQNKIKEVKDGFVSKANASDSEIDLKNEYVLPGLIDMHVHIESETNARSYMSDFLDNEADVAFEAARFAEITLMAGFTTVRDLGGTGVNISLRNAINKGVTKGPRIFAAGKSIATTGGHADPTNGRNKKLMGDPGPLEGVVNSPEDGVKAVRQRYKEGADVIKITATGGVLSVAKSGKNPQFTIEEIKAITQTAKDYNMLTAAHAHGDEGMQRAILGGIKTIEHGTFMSDATMELMKKFDVYLVPTITAGKEVAEKAKITGFYPEIVRPKALEVGPQIQETFGKAYKKGVKIAFGTDAGVFPHGINAKEFTYMVEAGMPQLAAIQSATIVNAKLLGVENEIGQLKENFFADIIAVNENPLEKISTLEQVTFVMKDGKIYKN
ncbi:metal-dependent hydrolase family protein [Flavobacterium sp. UBA6135]|uniref:metal-dependent hydrolase family protein n=1 Tax=Flavobacterium sp. UBA6135 TaxID=1946553 RepID=UPI0025C1D9A0|nr:amidohydrolase family protein [Flavobacterium sp. UBA6135]